MRPRIALLLCAFVALPAALQAGCGNSGGDSPADPALAAAAEGQDAQAKASVSTALVGAQLVYGQTQSFGSGAADLAARLAQQGLGVQAQTAPSASPDQVQLQGGGAQPVLLTAKSQSGSVAGVWADGRGTTRYYLGAGVPVYTGQAPAGAGWSESP